MTTSNNLLNPGTQAPDFVLNATPDQKVSLSEFLGQKVILVFYPADWSPVCGDQIALINETRAVFQSYNAVVVGISVDSAWSHMAYSQSRNLHFPLLSDFEPKGSVGKKYGVYRDSEGCEERAIFIVDEEGIIRWSFKAHFGINPGVDGIIDELEKLKTLKTAK